MTTDAQTDAESGAPGPVVITSLGAQGDGIAATASGELHIPLALPGETVTLAADGRAKLVGPPSPDRRSQPLCPHFPACGGCTLQHMSESLYRTWKGGRLADALAQRGLPFVTDPLRSVPPGTRRRATFTGRWIDGAFRLGFHGPRSHALEPITACAVLRPAIIAALPALTRIGERLCRRDEALRAQVLAADNGLDVALDTDGRARTRFDRAEIAGLAREARIVRLTLDGEPAVQLAAPIVTIAGTPVIPPPGAFLQAAAEADGLLADLVLAGLGKSKRVADLFAGLGTLSLAVAAKARVLAVDSDMGLLGALTAAHRQAQGLKPIDTLRRDLFRDPLSPKELEAFDAVVLDPPRAGARAQAEALARSKVGRLVMVSCNPATLARDLRTLVDGGYRLERATPVDQFLYTAHLEAVAVLRRP